MKYLYITFFMIFSSLAFAQSQDCNCCSENHDDFDFWLGSWTVTDPQGNPSGENTLEKIQNNCVIRENWVAARGNFTGTSYNFYNSSTNKWEQVWVDSNGGNLYLSGNKVNNKMILRTTDLKNKDGNLFFHRITWTDNEDGTVRQLWETVQENGEISIAFDGLYKRDQ